MSKASGPSALHVVFSGGVTGGHLFPGLAVAERIVELAPTTRITFVGPGGPFDREQVSRAGYDYVAFDCPRAPRRIAEIAPFGLHMLRGYREARRFLSHGASVVVGLGGYASLPAAVAASRRRLPLVLLEQNATLGRANRWLSRRAQTLCLAFPRTLRGPHSREIRPDAQSVVTGTPVRAAFDVSTSPRDRNLLMVLGGSNGARALNRGVPAALANLRTSLGGWQVVHQAGAADVTETEAAYRAAGIDAVVRPFCHDLAPLLARAGLAICRAGGSTLAELCVAGVPAILVPWRGAVDDHQRANAGALAAAGAAVMLDPGAAVVRNNDSTTETAFAARLQAEIERLLTDPARRLLLSAAAGRFARPQAALRVAQLVMRAAAEHSVYRPLSLAYPASPLSIDSRAA